MVQIHHQPISISNEALKKGVVIMDLQSYKRMAASTVPTIQLHGKAAKDLDKLVEEGLEEYYSGKAKEIKSLADLN